METGETNFKVELNGRDATKDLSPYLMGITYTDHLSGKADEIQVDLDNSDRRFSNEWFMSTGMTVKAWIGNMFCGTFSIDECSESSPPRMAQFRAQSAEYNSPIRNKNSFTHYKKTLSDIVNKYAQDHSLRVVGTIPDLNLETIIQYRISDIDFLHNLAKNYGCICSVKGGNLVFDSIENIWKREASKKIHEADMISWRFASSLPSSADGCVVAYDDIHKGEVKGVSITSGQEANDYVSRRYSYLTNYQYEGKINGIDFDNFDKDYDTFTGITMVVNGKVESSEEAKRIATGDIERKKNKKHTCNVVLPGDELLVAGNSIEILEVGKRSGYWLIEKSIHKIAKGNAYTTTIDVIHGAATTGAKMPTDPTYTGDFNSPTVYIQGIDGSGNVVKRIE